MGQLFCDKTPNPAPPSIAAPQEGCVDRNDAVLDELMGEDLETMSERYGDYLLEVSEAASAEAKRGNEHLKTALEEIGGMSTAFVRNERDEFASAGARTLAAVVGVESALDDGAELLDQEGMAWRQELTDARDELTILEADAADIETEMIADVDGLLGLDLEKNLDGSASERIEGVQVIAEVHLASGVELQALADLLGGVESRDARAIGKALAQDYGVHTETGTAHYYNSFMEDSEATQDVKGFFAYYLGIPLEDSDSYYQYDEEGQSCDVNEPGSLRALEEAKAARAAAAQKAMLDLGEVRDPAGGGFAKSAGRMADVLVTDDGEKATLEIKLKVVVPTPGGVSATVALNLNAAIGRAGDQRTAACGFEFLVGAELDAGIAKAFVEAGLVGKLSSSGDSFEEAFGLVMLGLYDRMHKTAPDCADSIFNGEKMEAVSDEMDADDFVEYSMGMKVAAGFEKQGLTNDGDASAGGSGELMWGTRLGGGAGEKKGLDVRRQDVSTASGKVEAKAGRFGVGASVKGRWVDDAFESIEAEAEGTAKVPGDEIADLLAGKVVVGMLEMIQGAATQGAAAWDPKQPAHRRMMSFGKQVSRINGADAMLKAEAHDALAEGGHGKTEVTYKIAVTGSASAKAPPKLSVALFEVSKVSAGSDKTPVQFEVSGGMERQLAKVELLG